MAKISAIQRLLDNQLTSKFARSLKHSDLPEGWADNPEIVALAEDAYREMGTESPFFKAWGGGNVLSNENGTPERVFRGLGENYKEATSNLPLTWVTPDHELANAYAYNSAKSLKNPSGGEVLSLYAKTASPFSFGFSGVADTTPQEMRGRIVKAISDSFVAGNISAAQGKKAIAKLKPLLTSDDGLVKNWEVWDNYPEIKESLSDIGHDALFALENGKPTYGVFNPAQLKSFFNRGTFNPADPNIYKGVIPAVGAGGLLALMGAEEAEAAQRGGASSEFWPAMARQFGLGTRGVIEGLGTGATLGFGDPGRWAADAIGLPSPETDIERQRVGLNAGVTDALTTFAGGVGAAKMAANPVVRGVGMELADKPLLGAGIGGLLGLLGYDYEEE